MCGRAALSESALWPGRPCERKGAERKSVQRVRVVISLQAVGCGAPGGGVAGEAERAETAEMAERESSSRVQAPGGTRRGFFGRAGTSRPNVAPERLPLARVALDAGRNWDNWQRAKPDRPVSTCATERHHCSSRRRHSRSPVAIAAVAVAGTSRQQQRRDTRDAGSSMDPAYGPGVPVRWRKQHLRLKTPISAQSVPQTTRFVVGERGVCRGSKALSLWAATTTNTPPHTEHHLTYPPPPAPPLSSLNPRSPLYLHSLPFPHFVSFPRRGRAVQERDQGYPPPV